jgi:hypothetical protein
LLRSRSHSDYAARDFMTSILLQAANVRLDRWPGGNGAGPNWPVQVGQTWSLDYTLTCGTTISVAYTQTGSVVGVESVTVPACTFTAIKMQTTITWTSVGGTTRTETTANWRDAATSHSVKQVISIAVSGTLPTTGYPVSRQIELQSSV